MADVKLGVAANAAAALLGSSVESLRGADRGGDEGAAFKRACVATLLADCGYTHDLIAEVLGFAGKSGPQKAVEFVRGRVQESSAFRISFHRMLSQVRTASSTSLRFVELRHAHRIEGDNGEAISSIIAAAIVLAEAIGGDNRTAAALDVADE